MPNIPTIGAKFRRKDRPADHPLFQVTEVEITTFSTTIHLVCVANQSLGAVVPLSRFYVLYDPVVPQGAEAVLQLAVKHRISIHWDEDGTAVTARYTLPGRFASNARSEVFSPDADETERMAAVRLAVEACAAEIS